MGKVLLEKLLYSCSDVKEIMILCREKRGQSAQERVEKMKKLEVRGTLNLLVCDNLTIFGSFSKG